MPKTLLDGSACSTAAPAKALGVNDARCAFAAHPIQDATDAGMQAKTDACAAAAVEAPTASARSNERSRGKSMESRRNEAVWHPAGQAPQELPKPAGVHRRLCRLAASAASSATRFATHSRRMRTSARRALL